MVEMGLGALGGDVCHKRKYRWRLSIDELGVIDEILPPKKSARPNLSFKTIEAQHLNESIHYPGKPDWKPINLTFYEIQHGGDSPIWKWLTAGKKKDGKNDSGIYDPNASEPGQQWKARFTSTYKFKVKLEMLDGCGEVVETWIYDHAWPENIEFGDLDYGDSEVVTVDVTLRYDRAYVEE